MTGTFITVEGIDGAGKTLAVEAIEEEFDPVTTSEPSDYWTGEQVRRALREETPPFMDFFLLMADRHHHIEEVIKPQIEKGNIVVSDRFADSTRAYQPVQFEEHIGDRSALGWIEKVMAPWNYEPDLTIYLKVSVETGLARCDQEEKYETKEMLEQVKENYESWIGFPTTEESRPSNHRRRDFAVIDAEQSKKQVRSEVVEVVEEVLND